VWQDWTSYALDNTMRDGERRPILHDRARKKSYGRSSNRLGVDIIESGFPMLRAATGRRARRGRETSHCSMAAMPRPAPTTIDVALEGLSELAHPRLHTFLATRIGT